MSHIEQDLRLCKCYGCSFSRLNYNILKCTYHGDSTILDSQQVEWYNLELFKKYRRFTPNQYKITCDINTRQLDLLFCWMIDYKQNERGNYIERITEMENEIKTQEQQIEELKQELKKKDELIEAYSKVLKQELK